MLLFKNWHKIHIQEIALTWHFEHSPCCAITTSYLGPKIFPNCWAAPHRPKRFYKALQPAGP